MRTQRRARVSGGPAAPLLRMRARPALCLPVSSAQASRRLNPTPSPTPTPPGYQLEALEAAVPGLEVLPLAFPLDRPGLLRLIKDNFRQHRGDVTELADGYTTLDQAREAGGT
jgi:hypothetical protein